MAEGNLTIELNPEDLKRFETILYGLSELERSQIIDKGLRDSTAVLVAEGKRSLASSLSTKPSNVARRTGRLESSFAHSIKKKKLTGYAGFKRPEGAPAHLLDQGTAERWTKAGAYRGKVTATKFWTNAVRAKSEEAIETLLDSVENSVLTIVDNGGKVQ